MPAKFVSDLTDANSSWNSERERLESLMLSSASALMAHTKAARITLKDGGVQVTLGLSEASGTVN